MIIPVDKALVRGFRRVPDASKVDRVFGSFSYWPGTQPLPHPWRWFEYFSVLERRVRSSTPGFGPVLKVGRASKENLLQAIMSYVIGLRAREACA